MFRPLVWHLRGVKCKNINIYRVCWDQSAEYGTYQIEGFFEKFMVMKTVPAAEENIE